MSLASRLQDLVTRIADEFKAIRVALVTGRVNIGTTDNTGEALRVDGAVRSAELGTFHRVYHDTFSTTDSYETAVRLRKSGLDTVGHSQTVDGERLGGLEFWGNSGAAFTLAARVRAVQAGAASTYTPAHLIFETANASDYPERMRITSGGNVLIGTLTDDLEHRLQVSGGIAGEFVTVRDSADPAIETKLYVLSVAGRSIPAFSQAISRLSSVQMALAGNSVAIAKPVGGNTTLTVLGLAISATGTATARTPAETNVSTTTRSLEYAVTTAAATAVAGFRTAQNKWYRGSASYPFGGFFCCCTFGPTRGATLATGRAFVGMTSTTTAPTDAEPSTAMANAIGIAARAADTNWQIMIRNGTGTAVFTDTGIPKTATDNTEMFTLYIYAHPEITGVGITLMRLSDGETFETAVNSGLPAANTMLGFQAYRSVGGTSSVIGIALGQLYVESEY